MCDVLQTPCTSVLLQGSCSRLVVLPTLSRSFVKLSRAAVSACTPLSGCTAAATQAHAAAKASATPVYAGTQYELGNKALYERKPLWLLHKISLPDVPPGADFAKTISHRSAQQIAQEPHAPYRQLLEQRPVGCERHRLPTEPIARPGPPAAPATL